MFLFLSSLLFGLTFTNGSPVGEASVSSLSLRGAGTADITWPSNPKQNGQAACAKLAAKYPGDTFLPNTANYTLESVQGTSRTIAVNPYED